MLLIISYISFLSISQNCHSNPWNYINTSIWNNNLHNIPIKCTDEEFRDIFYKAINNANSETRTHRGGIKECRVMRDLSRVNADGVGRSKGYGKDFFVL